MSSSFRDELGAFLASLFVCKELIVKVVSVWEESAVDPSEDGPRPGALFNTAIDPRGYCLLFLRVNERGVADLESVPTLLDGDPD